MGFLNFLSEVGEVMSDVSKEKSLEQLCNAINSDSLIDSFMIGSNSMELSSRVEEMDSEELISHFAEYSEYRVKNAARYFATGIGNRISTMKNREIMSAYRICSEMDDNPFSDLANRLQKELKRRGYI